MGLIQTRTRRRGRSIMLREAQTRRVQCTSFLFQASPMASTNSQLLYLPKLKRNRPNNSLARRDTRWLLAHRQKTKPFIKVTLHSNHRKLNHSNNNHCSRQMEVQHMLRNQHKMEMQSTALQAGLRGARRRLLRKSPRNLSRDQRRLQ